MYGFFTVASHSFLTLLPIFNPLGMSAVFLHLSRSLTDKERHRLAYQVAIYSFILLIFVLLCGPLVMRLFGVTLPFVRITGGLLIFVTGWQMFTAQPKLTNQETIEAKISPKDIAFFPLTMPLTAGAGAIAIVVTVATEIHGPHFFEVTEGYAGAIAGMACALLLVALCYRISGRVYKKLGDTGTNVVTRITAFILIAISLEVIWQGVQALILQIKGM